MFKLFWFVGICLMTCSVSAQDLLGETLHKKFPTNGEALYPYEFLDIEGRWLYPTHDPVVKLPGGTFAQLWRPDKISRRERIIRKYNVLMELLWQADFKLEREEEIIHVFPVDTVIQVLTSQWSTDQKAHQVYLRAFSVNDGEALETRKIWQIPGAYYQDPWVTRSEDGQIFGLFYLYGKRENTSPNFKYPYVDLEGQVGFQAQGVSSVRVATFDLSGKMKDQFHVVLNRKEKEIVMGCQIDNEGNGYLTSYVRKRKLRVRKFEGLGKSKELTYDAGVEVYDYADPETALLPGLIGKDQKVYFAFSEESKKGFLNKIEQFRIVEFDFGSESIDTSRVIPINPALHIRVNKDREAFGLKPKRRFEQYALRELLEMPDGKMWLITQKYIDNSYLGGGIEDKSAILEQTLEELVLYGFDERGKVRHALVVPTAQSISSTNERMGHVYDLHIDQDLGVMRFVTREKSGDKLRGPERVYLRTLDLDTFEVSDRMEIYDGSRREQFLLHAYTEWINSDILTLTVLEGLPGRVHTVTINVSSEELPEMDVQAENDRRRRR
ncbi:hypothetical protein [Pontibacter sp. G13]|uniref:hypothetical protein n=1 Tax=Pontibacter sp. G13 TaxID=3074898 RepID=UPI00288AAA10|nr:hypothetical protein [Pontibacter sp. G13]WNJ20655.1 hypothetical protein RJD25_09245 [Pontibacter sp. G13]